MEPTTIDLAALYRQIVADLRAAEADLRASELRAAELRGQKALIELLMAQAQRPQAIRDERDMLMSRLGEAHQTLDVMEGNGDGTTA